MLKYPDMVEQLGQAEQATGSEKPRNLKSGLYPISKGHSMGEYLDIKGYDREEAEFSEIRKRLSDGIISELASGCYAACDQWEKQNDRLIQIHGRTEEIQTALNDTALKGTIIGNDLENLLSVTRELMTLEVLEKQKKISKRYGFYQNVAEPYEQLMIFDLCGNLSMKVEGLSILDIVRRGKEISPVDYYNCQINAFVAKQRLDHGKILLKNRTQLTDRYPNKSKQLIGETLGEMFCMTELSPQLVESLFGFILPKDAITREVIQKVKDVVGQTTDLEQQVFKAILSPDSKYFQPLKELYEKYSNDDNPIIKILALRKLGLREKSQFVTAYRKVKELASKNGAQSQFYDKLAETIKRVNIEESPAETSILTHNDVIMFLNEDSSDSNTSFEELRKLTEEIPQGLLGKEYVINTSEIEWHGLIEPNSVSFKFDKNSQSKFTVTFYYGDDKDEKAELNFAVSTKKEKPVFDWEFLEAPDAPEMQTMKNAAMLSIKCALSAVLKQIESKQQGKQKAKPMARIPQPEKTPVKKTEQKEAYTPRAKEEKTKPQKLSFVERILQEEVPHTNNGVKSYINHEDPNFEKLIGDLPDTIKNQIKKGVLDLNAGLTNKFKALFPMRYEGKPVYGLIIGDYRVLAVEADSNGNGPNGSGEKLRKFIPIQVQHRKDIYGKKNIRRYR